MIVRRKMFDNTMDKELLKYLLKANWLGNESWLENALTFVYQLYKQLREDFAENAHSWNDTERCRRLSYHYFDLARYYNDELFGKYKVDLKSAKTYLKKCLENIERASGEIKEFQRETKNLLNSVELIYEEQKTLLESFVEHTEEDYVDLCIALGASNLLPITEWERLKRPMQNIELLRTTILMEDSITVADREKSFVVAQQSYYLARLYNVAGQLSFSESHIDTAQRITEKIVGSAENDVEDGKSIVKNIIYKELEDNKSNLQHIKFCIENMFRKKLSSTDSIYIERKYVKYCSNFWLKEIGQKLEELINDKNKAANEALGSLENIDCLEKMPRHFNDLNYSKLLIEHKQFFNIKHENVLINLLKEAYLGQIVRYSTDAKKQLLFLQALDTFLSSCQYLQTAVSKLELKKFYDGQLSFKKLRENVMLLEMNTDNLAALKEAATSLGEVDLLFKDKFKKVIYLYIQPVTVEVKTFDNRFILEVMGSNIVLSETLNLVNSKLSENSKIEEVHFIGINNICVDADLGHSIWHGKNLIILTKAMNVDREVKWDVSGQNEHKYMSHAGTGTDKRGKDGEDGFAGESGGNVSIFVDRIDNPKNLTIISNGAAGSNGQDGGPGEDGKNGEGISMYDFKEKFPNIVDDYKRADDCIKQTLKSIKEILQTVNVEWCTGYTKDNWLTGSTKNFTDDVIDRQIRNCETGCYNYENKFGSCIFLDVTTNRGNRIFFSCQPHTLFTPMQAFLLYKGSPGEAGGQGGMCGLGGEGGHAGNILENNLEGSKRQFGIKMFNKPGTDGMAGERGSDGYHGRNGHDMGYTTSQYTIYFGETWPKYYGSDCKSKIKLYYWNKSAWDRIFCPHEVYIKSDYQYALFEVSALDDAKEKTMSSTKVRQNFERRRHALATRKKNIAEDAVLARYSSLVKSSNKDLLSNLQSNLETVKQEAFKCASKVNSKSSMRESETEYVRVKHYVPFDYLKEQEHERVSNAPSTKIPPAESNEEKAERLIENLVNGTLKNIEDIFEFENVVLDFLQVESLFHAFNSLVSKAQESKLKKVEELLIAKYKFVICEEIAKQLCLLPDTTIDFSSLTPQLAIRYLIKVTETVDVSHNKLGTLSEYFFENKEEHREKISTFCKANNGILTKSVKEFILEVGDLQEVPEQIKHYYNDFREFLKNKEDNLNVFFEAFKTELCHFRHAETFDLYMKSLENESLQSQLISRINEDKFLATLYNNFISRFKEYDWTAICQDEIVLNEFHEYIKEEGPLSRSYRELLASIFDVNIRLYVTDKNQRLSLKDNLNPFSNKTISILFQDDKFVSLCIDERYFKLEENRKRQTSIYEQVLIKIESFKKKEELDNYLANKSFSVEITDKKSKKLYYDNLNDYEKEHLTKIVEFFPEERKQMRLWLKKITYTKQRGILYNLSKRFSNEGRHISVEVMCSLINFVITAIINGEKEMGILCWIITACPQKFWINELILLQLENYFREPLAAKIKWREYLSKVKNQDLLLQLSIKLYEYESQQSLSTEQIDYILYLLSKIPSESLDVENLKLIEWSYALKESYWTLNLSQLIDWPDIEKLQAASYYLLHVENTFGTPLVEQLIEALRSRSELISPESITKILYHFYTELWNLSEEELRTFKESSNVAEWEETLLQKFNDDGKERKMKDLFNLIKSNANNSKGLMKNLEKMENLVRKIDFENAQIYGLDVNTLTDKDVKSIAKKLRETSGLSVEEMCKQLLPVINRAIELTKGFKLRDTQLLTIIALLTNDCNVLAQVSTGEGKSLIVVSVSIIKALCGEKIDIVTSSSVLAERDAKEYQDVFALFDINVSHNCSESLHQRKAAYSGNQVIYGDLSNFQRDYLLDRFYLENILGDRDFQSVIVDEVDSMLLDKGNNMLYLSHDISGFDKLESVYFYIWSAINKPGNFFETFDVQAIKEALLDEIHGFVTLKDLQSLDPKLSEEQANLLRRCLTRENICDDQGRLLQNVAEKVKAALPSEFEKYAHRLLYLLKERGSRQKYVHVPKYLVAFVEEHLESWINSAVMAFFMRQGQDYVVDIDRSDSNSSLHPDVVILDRDTGTDMVNSQWNDGLHQFLQLKHGCKLSLQSLKTVFISNVSYFKRYEHLYGLTGTLGSYRERDLLKSIHEVDFVVIPTAKSKQFIEEKPVLCAEKHHWLKRISEETKRTAQENGRSVLVICDTVNDVIAVRDALQSAELADIQTYTRDFENFDIVQGGKKLSPGRVIVATNLAGRGTDIKLDEDLKKAGGLHVCLTYLPNNVRIEQQAFGRAARHGDKGSGQLIFLRNDGRSTILDLKKKRDAAELQRISDVNSYYRSQITVEEHCFKKFEDTYKRLHRDLDSSFDKLGIKDNDKTELKKILLESCLEKWIFWLDKQSREIKHIGDDKNRRNFNESLNVFIRDLNRLPMKDFEDMQLWVNRNPNQMLKFGKFLQKQKNLRLATKIYNETIALEPYFCAAVHYYKAQAVSAQIDWSDKSAVKAVKEEFRVAERLFEEQSKFSSISAILIGKMKQKNDKSIIKITPYEDQQKNMGDLFYILMRSVNNLLGHPVTPHSFLSYDVRYDLADELFEGLLEEGVLKQAKIKRGVSKEDLFATSNDFGLPAELLANLFSKYAGKNVDLKEFQKALKQEIPLPCREVFWETLVEQRIFNEETKYVIVDGLKFRDYDSKLYDHVEQKLNGKTFESSSDCIFLYQEQLSQMKEHEKIFLKADFVQTVGKGKYTMLKKAGLLSSNKRARVDKEKLGSATFSCFDSISPADLASLKIPDEEAREILSQLVDQKLLSRKQSATEEYQLAGSFEKIEEIQLPTYPVYTIGVKTLLLIRFAFRIASQKLEKELLSGEQEMPLKLLVKPHKCLTFEFLERKLIKPVRVARKEKKFIEAAVEKILLKAAAREENRAKSLVANVMGLSGLLKTLEVPDLHLKHLNDLFEEGDFGRAEEVRLFELNGSEHVILAAEKRWTGKMIFNTVVVIVMGVCQIIIGVLIEVLSIGLLTPYASSLIGEGVSDLFFAAGCLMSGYFSWSDYWQHKKLSLAITAVTFGMGTLYRSVTSFGQKVTGPLVTVGRQAATATKSQLFKVTMKRVVQTTAKGLAFGVADSVADKFIENYLEGACRAIGSTILQSIEKTLKVHPINERLEKAYRVMGKAKIARMVQFLCTQTERKFYERFMTLSQRITDSVLWFFVEEAKRRGLASGKAQLTVKLMNQLLSWSNKLVHLESVFRMTQSFLDEMDEMIEQELSQHSQNDAPTHDDDKKDYKSFRAEVVAKWEDLISERAKYVVQQNIVAPLVKSALRSLVCYAGRAVKELNKYAKECNLLREYQQLKRNYQRKVQKTVCAKGMEDTVKRVLKQQFEKNVMDLAAESRNPKLLAALIREGFPLDLTSVALSAQAIPELLEEIGAPISGLHIDFVTDNGLQQTIVFQRELGARTERMKLQLRDNHYVFSEKDFNRSGSNDCLYEAYSSRFPALRKLSPEVFRERLAFRLEQDSAAQRYVQEGWHEWPIRQGVYGGAQKPRRSRVKSEIVGDEESSELTDGQMEEHQLRVRRGERHLVARLTYFLRLGGVLQRTSEQTGLSRAHVLVNNETLYQDRSSGRGTQVHAAHVVKTGTINPAIGTHEQYLAGESSALYNELRNFFGHTQNVERTLNAYHLIGGYVDRFQVRYLSLLNTIDFSRSLTDEDAQTLRTIRDEYVRLLKEFIWYYRLSNRDAAELIVARNLLRRTRIETLYEHGRRGYLGEMQRRYERPYRGSKDIKDDTKDNKNDKNSENEKK